MQIRQICGGTSKENTHENNKDLIPSYYPICIHNMPFFCDNNSEDIKYAFLY